MDELDETRSAADGSRTRRAAVAGLAGLAGLAGAGRALRRRARAVHRRMTGTGRDAGMATAEYAIVMIAAVGFAGLLVVILRSAEVREALTSLVRSALSV
jgi:hypothetical protein